MLSHYALPPYLPGRCEVGHNANHPVLPATSVTPYSPVSTGRALPPCQLQISMTSVRDGGDGDGDATAARPLLHRQGVALLCAPAVGAHCAWELAAAVAWYRGEYTCDRQP